MPDAKKGTDGVVESFEKLDNAHPAEGGPFTAGQKRTAKP